MSFISLKFFLIAAITAAVYHILPLRYRWMDLLVMSVVFYYYSAGAKVTIVLMAETALIWFLTRKMAGQTEKKKKRYFLLMIVSFLILLLVISKLVRFINWRYTGILIPLGISYYTFSLISYVMDIYYGKSEAEENYFRLLLFTICFMKIVQGPISKYRTFGKNLMEGHPFSWDSFCFGLQRMLCGYFKKLVIAERAVIFVNSVFREYSSYSSGGAILLFAAVLNALYLYFDFSGYMDIVIGLSETMGIELDENFKRPFFSRSAAEFWRRWHITLGIWFRDYVYMPLAVNPVLIRQSAKIRKKSGKRAGKAFMQVIPTAVVWILTGLWHGTGIRYISWGIYWGTLIIISTVFAPEIQKLNQTLHINTKSRGWAVFCMVRTFFLFVIGRLISSALSLPEVIAFFPRVVSSFAAGELFSKTITTFGLNQTDLIIMTVSILVVWLAEIFQERGVRIRKWLGQRNPVLRWSVYAAVFVLVVFLGYYGPAYDASEFAYAVF